MPATLLCELRDGILILVHGHVPPSDEDWDGYMDVLTRHGAEIRCVLVFTDGVGPNSAQRAKIQDATDYEDQPAVVITDSMAVRGIVTAVRWLGKNIRAFKPSEIASAFEFVKLATDERRLVLARVAVMRARLDEPQSSMARPRSDALAPASDPEVKNHLDRVRERVAAIRRQQK